MARFRNFSVDVGSRNAGGVDILSGWIGTRAAGCRKVFGVRLEEENCIDPDAQKMRARMTRVCLRLFYETERR